MYSIQVSHFLENKPSEIDCTIEDGKMRQPEWDTIVRSFRDGVVSQTWAWGNVKYGQNGFSHIVLKKRSSIVSAAQVRLLKIPYLQIGIASVMRGPMWKPTDGGGELAHFRTIIRFLKLEYAEKRGLCLRITPSWSQAENEEMTNLLVREGFQPCQYRQFYRTLILDLSPSIDELRENLKRQWRQKLEKALQSKLTVVGGETDELFKTFSDLYKKMLLRKRSSVSPKLIDAYRSIQKNLDSSLKMQLRICEFEGEPVAGLVVSHIGGISTVLFAATSVKGMNLRASFLLWWKTIEACKEAGAIYLDLHGIDPERNPGGYQFKSGIVGKGAQDIYQKEFVYCTNSFSSSLDRFSNQGRSHLNRIRRKTTELSQRAGIHLYTRHDGR